MCLICDQIREADLMLEALDAAHERRAAMALCGECSNFNDDYTMVDCKGEEMHLCDSLLEEESERIARKGSGFVDIESCFIYADCTPSELCCRCFEDGGLR